MTAAERRTDLDALLANPADYTRRVGRSLPAAVFGVWLPVTTPCGIISRSASQTATTLNTARARRQIEHLTDSDVLWLLLMGWTP